MSDSPRKKPAPGCVICLFGFLALILWGIWYWHPENRVWRELYKTDGSSYLSFLLFDHPQLVNLRDDDGKTLLHIAVHLNKFEDVSGLLSFDADFNAETPDGLTPLDLATDETDTRIIDILHSYIEKPTLPTACLEELIDSLENPEDIDQYVDYWIPEPGWPFYEGDNREHFGSYMYMGGNGPGSTFLVVRVPGEIGSRTKYHYITGRIAAARQWDVGGFDFTIEHAISTNREPTKAELLRESLSSLKR